MTPTGRVDKKTAKGTDTPKGANLILKAIEVLDAVSQSATPPRLTEVVKRTGLATGTAYRILETLAAKRLLRREDVTRTYRLGPRFLQMARGAWEDYDIRAAAAPELDLLLEQLGHILMLSVLVDDNLVIIDRRHGKDSSRVPLSIGTSLVMHCTASGKAVLAASDRQRLAELDLVPVTPHTILDPVAFKAQIEIASSNRFAIDDEESSLGVRGCAAPVVDERGSPIGAISFSGPADILSVARLREVGPILAEAAERISWNLGFNPPERWSDLDVARNADEVERVSASSAFVGANPTWHVARKTLYWSDRTKAMIRYNDKTGRERAIALPARAQAIAECKDGLTLVLPDGVYRLDLDTEKPELVRPFDCFESREICLTGTTDACGRLWITTTDRTLASAGGGLWRMDLDLTLKRVAGGLLFPMGIAWSPGNDFLYFSDGPKRQIYRAPFNLVTGTMETPTVFVQIPEGSGRPSGLAVDREGYVWNVRSEGWSVVRYTPGGEEDQILRLPVSRPLDCGFGGDDRKTLFVTSAKLGLPERRVAELPLSGFVLAYRTGVPGLPRYATTIGCTKRNAARQDSDCRKRIAATGRVNAKRR